MDAADDDIIEPLRGDEVAVPNMDIDGDAAHNILELLDADDDDDDELFDINIDEMEEETDDELVYDDSGLENSSRPLALKMKGYKPNLSRDGLSEASKAILFWRDGENNYSDWRINVVTKKEDSGEDESISTTYHVNKMKIARGPNKSDYFATLFDSDSFSENDDDTSTVNLTEEVAAQFPVFLDYIYSLHTESESVINFQNWKSMISLANYFQVSKLQKDVWNFIEKDLYNLDHLGDYLSEFNDIDEDDQQALRILSKTARVCAIMIRSIEPASQLVKSIPPRMFLSIIDILGQRCVHSGFDRYHVNCLVLGYLHEHNIEDKSYFSALSDMMGVGFFPHHDDFDFERAGELALSWFQLMGQKGWRDDWFEFICTTFLRRYLSSHEPSTELMERVVKEVPHDIVARLYREALLVKPGRKKEIKGLEFKIRELTHHTLVGDIDRAVIPTWSLLLPIHSTDSIALLKIAIACHWGRGILSRSWKMDLVHNGVVMEDGKIMSSYEFTADDNLILVRLRVA